MRWGSSLYVGTINKLEKVKLGKAQQSTEVVLVAGESIDSDMVTWELVLGFPPCAPTQLHLQYYLVSRVDRW